MIQRPEFTACFNQPAHSPYTTFWLANGATMTTTNAQGITVMIIHSMCNTERIRFIKKLVVGAGRAGDSSYQKQSTQRVAGAAAAPLAGVLGLAAAAAAAAASCSAMNTVANAARSACTRVWAG